MERGCNGNGGVKVTFIETQFVTSDAAGFKSLVQRLTGNDAATCDLADMLRVDVAAGGGGCHGGGGRR
uniref:VQ domain-containing protein n=1 Tax=Oryza barthii TaxID=65489 RepID=A0A0D3F348_9ORYZ